jgi:2-oxoglutarate ferredoxin oxidoreductase subunit gamma
VLLLRAELTANEGDAPARLHWGMPSYQRELETVPMPLDWASALEAAFVGRGCVHDGAQLARVLRDGLDTRGLSVVGITGASELATGTFSRNAWPEHFAAYRAWAATLPPTSAITAHVIDPPAHHVDRCEVRLAGIGGQGIKLAGTVLAEAAGLHAGLFATERGDYGSATRGGQSAVDVVIGSDPITYAGADHADVLVLLSQAAADRYARSAKTGAFVFADTTNVPAPPAGAIPIRIADLAREHTGKIIAAGVVSLGCVAAVTNAISMRALELAIREHVPAGVVEANLAACTAGYAAARGLLEGATA